jgi:hypothetical protein
MKKTFTLLAALFLLVLMVGPVIADDSPPPAPEVATNSLDLFQLVTKAYLNERLASYPTTTVMQEYVTQNAVSPAQLSSAIEPLATKASLEELRAACLTPEALGAILGTYATNESVATSIATAIAAIPAPGYLPLDANDVAAWPLNEGPGVSTYASAVAGISPMTTDTLGTGTFPGVAGPAGNSSVRTWAGNNGRLISAAGEAEPNYPVTFSVWIKMLATASPYAPQYIGKTWYPDTWTGRFRSVALLAGWQGNVGAIIQTTNTPTDTWIGWISAQYLSLYTWNNIVVTYDGARAKWYLNGQKIGDIALTGNIEYGAHGRWFAGVPKGDSWDATGDYQVAQLRISNVVRDEAYILHQYRAGIGFRN